MANSKRILLITYELPPIGGGVGTSALNLLNEFQKYSNFNIDVITSSRDSKYHDYQLSPNVTIYQIPISKDKSTRLSQQSTKDMALFSLNSTRFMRKLLSTKNYDLFHFYGYPGAWPGIIFHKKIPFIISLRGVDVPGYNQKFGLQYTLYKPLTKLSWQLASGIVANSQWLKQRALAFMSDAKISIIPNGVDTDLYMPIAESKKHKKFTITAGGTLMNSKKNLHILISSFADFHKQIHNSQLILFGSGDMEPALKLQVNALNIKDSVKFKGKLSQAKLAKTLPKCHVLCLPSSAEGLSNAALEGLASGLPLILTDTGNAKDIVQGNGYIISRSDAAFITSALLEIYKSPKNRQDMAKRSRQIARKFNWSKYAKNYIDFYENSLG